MISNFKFPYKKIGVLGLGYVGLPIIKRLLQKKFDVLGFDIDTKKIQGLIKSNRSKKKIFTSNQKDLFNRDFYVVCVPTPINKSKKPDLSALKLASKIVGKNLKKNNIVVYESTVFPGCTEDICIPILEKSSGLKINKDFFCGYSPERINPEDRKHILENITKVTSGSNDYSSKIIDNFYKILVPAGTYRAESIKIAEAAKAIENVQRDLNIALINEFSLIFDRMGLDTFKILKAASSKWNFLNFKPGLVGGHCIGVDPYYLTFKSQQLKYNPKIILAGRKLNDNMPFEISKKILNHFKNKKANLKNQKILIVGYSFKENSQDIRNTKVLDLFKILKKNINKIDIYDPIVNVRNIFKNYKIKVKKTIKEKNYYDAVIIAVPHDKILNKGKKNLINLAKKDALFIDIKGVL